LRETAAPSPVDTASFEPALERLRAELLSHRVTAGHWEGELSSSALSTATAVCALEVFRRRYPAESDRIRPLVRGGLAWLCDHPNDDGGFGDTTRSPSNISTTALAWATLGMFRGSADPAGIDAAFSRAEGWLRAEAGELGASSLAEVISKRYGVDRTFSVPILTLCAVAGRFGGGAEAWRSISRLPFELAALPHAWFSRVGLPVVSYALPALIAIGQAQHGHLPSRNPLARLVRSRVRARTLRVLESIQPASGGFLEATPLTSFVTLSLASIGAGERVVRRCAAFLEVSARKDGSWPIDTNLATWLTTLSIEALGCGGRLAKALSGRDRAAVTTWLLAQQTTSEHPYTHAAPGAWAWTDRSGGVPDADDTAGALVALARLRDARDERAPDPRLRRAAEAGVAWLLGLQNRDGGIPTFCRGWGKLPFDRSAPDLTAHALRAWAAWRAELSPPLSRRVGRAMLRASRYLLGAQREDGAWVPLWFGNDRAPGDENPVYGTARVLACEGIVGEHADPWRDAARRGGQMLLAAQDPSGGFGGAPGVPPTVEETALCVEALAARGARGSGGSDEARAVAAGCAWLVRAVSAGRLEAAPIGLYFAKLWYHERLYPRIFAAGALERVRAGRRRGLREGGR